MSEELRRLKNILKAEKNYTQYELSDAKKIFLAQVEMIIKTPRFTKAAVANIAHAIFIQTPVKDKQRAERAVACSKGRKESNRLFAQKKRQATKAKLARIINAEQEAT